MGNEILSLSYEESVAEFVISIKDMPSAPTVSDTDRRSLLTLNSTINDTNYQSVYSKRSSTCLKPPTPANPEIGTVAHVGQLY